MIWLHLLNRRYGPVLFNGKNLMGEMEQKDFTDNKEEEEEVYV